MTSLPLIGFFRVHRRIILALLGVVVSSAFILPACGDGSPGITQTEPADFAVTKTGVVSGQTITYTITVTNTGTTSAGVTVSDVVSTAPAGSQFTAATGGTCSVVTALSYSCTVGAVSAGGTHQIVLVLAVPPGPGGGVVNCASVPADANNSNNQSCVENTVAPSGGSITIVKNTDPDDPQDFHFTSGSSAIPAFDLDDDANATLSNQKTFTNLSAGTYTFTETQVSGWDLSSISCAPSAGTTVSIPTATATVALTAGAAITCTFTNKVAPPTTGTITIIKDAVPNVAQDFGFTSNKAAIPAFLLDDDADGTLPNQRVFASVAADTYIITETATPGWSLANIACTPAASVVANIAAGTSTITLAGGANVSCTYTNTPVVPVVDAVSTTTASSTTTSVTLTGSGFLSGSDVTLRNTTTSETFTNRSVTSTTSSQLVFTHTFGITTAPQSWTVEVAGPNGAKSALRTFTVLPSVPALTALTPSPSAPAVGQTVVLTISGVDFSAPDARVSINVTPVNDPPSTIAIENAALTAKSSTQLVGSFTPTVAGTYAVRVQNGAAGVASNSMSFSVIPAAPMAATITGVTPAAPTGSERPQVFTITGRDIIQQPILSNDVGNFRNVTTGQTFGCPTSCSVISSSSTQIVLTPTFPIASTAQNWTVTVNNPGAPASNAFAFTVNPPTPAIASVSTTPSPPVGGAAFTLTLTGSDFSSTEARIGIAGPGCAAGCAIENSALTVKTATTLVGSLTLSAGGTYSATVRNGTGPTSNAMTFTVAAPSPAAFIVLTPSTVTTIVGGTAGTTASFLDASRAPTTEGCALTFSMIDAAGIATVSASGLNASLTGRSAGTTGLRAACASGTGIEPFVGGVKITESELSEYLIILGPRFSSFPESTTSTSQRFTGVAKDKNGNTIAGSAITYAFTNTGTGTVSMDAMGNLTIGPTAGGAGGPAKRGGGTVTARAGGQSTVAWYSYGAVGTIAGRITSTGGQSLIGYTARTSGGAAGPVVGDVDGDGYFGISNLPVGSYIVETVAPNGTILGTSALMTVTAGTTTEMPNTVVALRAASVR